MLARISTKSGSLYEHPSVFCLLNFLCLASLARILLAGLDESLSVLVSYMLDQHVLQFLLASLDESLSVLVSYMLDQHVFQFLRQEMLKPGPEEVMRVEPFHYGSHYSNSGTVLHYLVRLPPFTRMFLSYQGLSLLLLLHFQG